MAPKLSSAVLAGTIFLAAAGSWAPHARADGSLAPLISEIDALRNSLPSADRSRPELTLRLADLLFDQTASMSDRPDEALRIRRKALALYEEALSGAGGRFPVPGEMLRTKIRFQMAKLLAELPAPDSSKAQPIWKELAAQSEMVQVQREATLRLAEAASPADADRLYIAAIRLCGDSDLCNYAHFKRAWLLRNQGKLSEAVTEMQLALWDSKGQVREEPLRDLVSFMALLPGDGHESLKTIESLATKLSRPSLLTDLAEAYFAAGNKPAGTETLAFVNSRAPQLVHQIRLLEEYYGLRNWDRFAAVFDQAEDALKKGQLGDATLPNGESEKILRRLAVQLDGERISQPQHVEPFKRTALLYLSVYPQSKEKMKLVEGWMAAETDGARKISQIQAWLGTPALALSKSEEIRLREIRASTAQKIENQAVWLEETAALALLTSSREHSYHHARALYASKKFDEAVPHFQKLAALDAVTAPDSWAIQSQNLLLDIHNQRKDFRAIMTQARAWLKSPAIERAALKDAKLKSELVELGRIADEAEFELAASLGETPEALASFQTFCAAGKMTAKSCENARILAIKLKSQDSLLLALKAQGKEVELAEEYEAAGYFAKSAELREKLFGKVPALETQLKTALLYEAAGDITSRDRVLKALMKSFKGARSIGNSREHEALVLASFEDTSIYWAELLALPFSADAKVQIAEKLEVSGSSSNKTRDLLLQSPFNSGPAWSARVLELLKSLDREQAKISFYGSSSRTKFERRIAALKKLATQADRYLPIADRETRVRVLKLLELSHRKLVQEIEATPLPPNLPDEAMTEVKASLAQLSEPFGQKATAYTTLLEEQIASAESANERPALRKLAEQLANGEEPIRSQAAAPVRSPAVAVETAKTGPALQALNRDPSDAAALEQLRQAYETAGQVRLAAYFKGRVQALGMEKAK